MTRQLILATAGHIDHGKTALVRALTGTDTDRLPEEKQRGITIDIGFAHLPLPDLDIGIVDVPGHERFIKNMLAGASAVNLALLVVAADDSVMPQTREHLAILQLLDVRHAVVAITKSDLAAEDWLALVQSDIRDLLAPTPFPHAPVVRTSARTGAGLGDLRAAIATVADTIHDSDPDQPFRMAVDRAFVARGVGTVVTGTVWNGAVSVGDELELLPARRPVRIRAIQCHDQTVDSARRAQRAALNLPAIHHTDISRGDELAAPHLFDPAPRAAAHLRILTTAPWPLKHRARIRLHIGTGEVIASVRLLDRASLEPGADALVELACARPIVAMAGQPFVIRAESPMITIGGGTILQSPSRIRRRHAEDLHLLADTRSPDPLTSTAAAIALRGPSPWQPPDLWQAAALWSTNTTDTIERLTAAGTLRTIGNPPTHIHTRTFDDIAAQIIRALSRLHDEAPLQTHIPRQRLAQALTYLDPTLTSAVIDELLSESKLTGNAADLALPGRRPILTAAQERIRSTWLTACDSNPFTPPMPPDIAAQANTTEDEARRVATVCAGLGDLIRITDDIYLLPRHHDALIQRITTALTKSPALTVSQIKDLLNTTRKYAVPLCEHLDTINVTTRRADVRFLRAPPPS